jgi:hypothetical protein
MSTRILGRVTKLGTALLVAVAAIATTAGAANAQEVVYQNIPNTLPGNFASFGNEAYSMQEFGGMIQVANPGHRKQTVTVAMSSWACQTGTWFEKTCETTEPQKKFKWPITLNIYEVGPGDSVGAKLATATKIFKMPYRPSRDPKCGSPPYEQYEKGTWFDAAENRCYHGLAFTITFKAVRLEVRAKEIITVSYNTTDFGPAPVGKTACNATVAGCFYDSLNVAITEPSEGTLSVGSDPTTALYLNSTYAEMYCSGPTPVGTFGPTAPIEGACASNNAYGTEAGIQPAISVSAH